jgi:hypothetical protein
MIWYFSRGSAQIDLEVRRAPESGGYELVVVSPDGSERIERFDEPRRLIARALVVQRRLIKKGWVPTSPAGPQATTYRPAVAHAPLTYIDAARLAVSRLQQSVRRRIAAAFGL